MRLPKQSFSPFVRRSVILVAAAVLALSFLSAELSASDATTGATVPFSETKIRIEFNSTDEDVGIQVFLDADAWRKVRIVAPNGTTIFEVNGSGKLRQLGLTELFFESEEPSLEDLPLDEFLALFPEGEYEFFGTTAEGERLVGTATFTHNIPDGPDIVSPRRGEVVDPKKVVIDWDPVTTPAGIEVVRYQVIVEGDNPLRTFSIDLPATITRVKVPSSFFEANKKYKVEVLAIDAGGNQTISEKGFRTE